ncbi:MAG: class I SAM-dependent DNA methyltransferase [Lachnospiraceae bacterium]|nr:class I SAM-dependent DNA methyltransferase [Lachnospiraceae bacterium]
MKDIEQRQAAKKFAKNWAGRGYEKGESQIFWIELLTTVYGVEDISNFISFEDQVKIDHTSFIDGYIDKTHVMIEQKSIDKNLTAPIKQSDGSLLTPFQQAKRYSSELPYSKRPRWIVTSNFKCFYVYDMEQPSGEPEIIELENLEKEYYRLQFLVDEGNEHLKKEIEVSIKAGELVGLIYDALYKQYINPDENSLKSLNMLCVRLVFCFYAEDAGIFGRKEMFSNYMAQFSARDWRKHLIELFQVLDTKVENRDKYIENDLTEFPYVNGGLFADENIEIPQFTDEIVELMLNKASTTFDWSEISPTIFGAVFESTLNPETRRAGGMHYTSIENIHKVIDPLFMDELNSEFEEIKFIKVERTRRNKLQAFQKKLSELKFLDPACGSGNFLTETYISLRKLENKIIMELQNGQMVFGEAINPIQVSISQFYGIEINDFAVTVAKTALWIAESQMMKETEDIVHMQLDFLPLKTNAYIEEGNALRIDWNDVVPKYELNYIMGNPPFVGYSLQSKEQKEDVLSVYVDEKGNPYNMAGKIDFVSAWYFKASEYIKATDIKVAFVSTNSITQGEQVSGVWKPLYERFDIHIDFAYKTFKWNSESKKQAAVYCIIVGFSNSISRGMKKLFINDNMTKEVKNINPYLFDAPNIFVEARTKPLCDVPSMIYGNKPTDGGYLFLSSEEREAVLIKEPEIEKYIKKIYGATEFINNKQRYCLWLDKVNPADIKKSKFIMDRVNKVKQFRLNSNKQATRKSADTPTLFQEIRQPNEEYIIIPRHSSENRRYIPFGFVLPDIIVNDAVQIIPNAKLYHFGVLTSNVHMSWMRAVAGRLEMRYRYSKDIVYNNFPWCEPSPEQKKRIEETAQAILDARAIYPECSLADLYDELTMPPELRKAHQQNDKAVMQAYGFWGELNSESECVAELMKMYQELVE